MNFSSPLSPELCMAFQNTLDELVARHPKIRAIKVGLAAQYLTIALFGRCDGEAMELLRMISRGHAAASSTEQWTKERGRYSESLHGWIARRGWEDVLPEPQKDDLDELRAAADRYRQEKRVR